VLRIDSERGAIRSRSTATLAAMLDQQVNFASPRKALGVAFINYKRIVASMNFRAEVRVVCTLRP
jgi:hypothetical protein